MNLIERSPSPQMPPSRTLSFDDWVLCDNNRSLSSPPFQSETEAETALEAFKTVYPDLSLTIFTQKENGQARIRLSKNAITLYCYRAYPELAARVVKLWDGMFVTPDPKIVPIPRDGILDYNMRKAVYDEADFITKLQKRFDEAQQTLDMPPNPTWDLAVQVADKENVSAENGGERAISTDCGPDGVTPSTNVPLASEGLNCYAISKEQGFRFLRAAAASSQGRRKYQEDRFRMGVIGQNDRSIPYFAVFDGHSGSGTAEFLKEFIDVHLEVILNHFLQFPDPLKQDMEIFSALKIMFLFLGRYFAQTAPDDKSHSTALLALVIDGVLWVVNVGDSRAILCTEGFVTALSMDAGLQTKKDCSSVWKRGQNIFDLGTGRRVCGFNLSRAVNHDEKMSGINPRGQIIRYELGREEKPACLVMGSDGLFKSGSQAQVGERAISLLQRGCSSREVAKDLVAVAISSGSIDNVTALVVDFTPAALQDGQETLAECPL